MDQSRKKLNESNEVLDLCINYTVHLEIGVHGGAKDLP